MSTNALILEPDRPQAVPGPLTSTEARQANDLGLIVSDNTLEHETSKEMGEILGQLTYCYNPQNFIEEELVRQLAVSIHRLRRFDRMETAAMFSDETARTRHEASVIMQQKYASQPNFMEYLNRSRAQAERSFNRVYKFLEERRRIYRQSPPPTKVTITEDTRHQPLAQNKPSFYGRTPHTQRR